MTEKTTDPADRLEEAIAVPADRAGLHDDERPANAGGDMSETSRSRTHPDDTSERTD